MDYWHALHSSQIGRLAKWVKSLMTPTASNAQQWQRQLSFDQDLAQQGLERGYLMCVVLCLNVV